MKIALLQITSTGNVHDNAHMVAELVGEAAAQGAQFIATPEVSNLLTPSREEQAAQIHSMECDPFLTMMRDAARAHEVEVLIGSLALRSDNADPRHVNRSVMIGATGEIIAQYDKIHLFDVQINAGETFRESAHYQPGQTAVLAQTRLGPLGMSVCYDLRFPHLYRDLAKRGARVLSIPAAFAMTTGAAHWEVLLRARAIETGCFILAPAQCGTHRAADGRVRRSYGHSLIVSPWGDVITQANDAPQILYADIDHGAVDAARARVPSLDHDRPYEFGY